MPLHTLEVIGREMIRYEGLATLSYLPHLFSILLVLILLWVSKKVFDLFSDYTIEYQLVKADNKAITVGFVAYLAGVAIILEGVLEGGTESVLLELVNITVWGLIGILLLNLAGKINNRWILRRSDNTREMLENHNIGMGVVMAGGYIGSAMIIRSIILGPTLGWIIDIVLILFYFCLAQLVFVLYGLLYERVTRYDFLKEIQEGNVAAGISFGFNLAAIGILVAIPLRTSFSLVLFGGWLIVGISMMVFFRFIMDRMIIPMEKLDSEIHQDRNWGIALLEGCFSIAAVVLLQSIFI
jgi:uncharacterized membrane protein YjfL (UPF0719 family)